MAHHHLYSQGPTGRVHIVATRENRHTLRDLYTRARLNKSSTVQFIKSCLMEDSKCALFQVEAKRSKTPGFHKRTRGRQSKSSFSNRNGAILRRRAQGQTYKEIAHTLSTSVSTVNNVLSKAKRERLPR